MRKFLNLFVCFGLILGLVACSSNEKPKEEKNEEKNEEKKEKAALNFDAFENALKNNGYTITEKIQMAADLIGGIDGIKFETNKGSVEIYKFDIDSEAYKNVVNNGKVTLEDFGDIDATYKNEFVILQPTEEIQNILSQF